jgi:hypothetical protein
VPWLPSDRRQEQSWRPPMVKAIVGNP